MVGRGEYKYQLLIPTQCVEMQTSLKYLAQSKEPNNATLKMEQKNISVESLALPFLGVDKKVAK